MCNRRSVFLQYKPDPSKDKLVTLDHTLQYRQCWNEVELTDMYMTKGTFVRPSPHPKQRRPRPFRMSAPLPSPYPQNNPPWSRPN